MKNRNRILVTGGCGFIGTNFVRYMLENSNCEIVVVDALTYAGRLSNLDDIRNRILFVYADICDEARMEPLVAETDLIVHFAAETHVDRSINDPAPFLRTNILGTETLLRLAVKYGVWFHHVSTDEVFGSLPLEAGFFTEETKYDPHSPYSASKAASDHLVRAYGETYGLKYSITNCSNNYGPFQTAEKVIPLFIMNALEGKPLPVYGDGLCVRDYLYVIDHCRAIDLVIHYASSGSTYCVGGGIELNTIQLAETIKRLLGSDSLIEFVTDRPGHDRRYGIDSSKIQRELGWKPSVSFEEGITRTINWYKE